MYPSTLPGTFRRGGHGLFSTTDDYAKFARMLLNGKTPDGKTILSRKMVEAMRANRLPTSQLPIAIGPNAIARLRLGARRARDDGRRPGDESHRRRRTRLGWCRFDVLLGGSEGRTHRRDHGAVPRLTAADERRPARCRISDDRLTADRANDRTERRWRIASLSRLTHCAQSRLRRRVDNTVALHAEVDRAVGGPDPRLDDVARLQILGALRLTFMNIFQPLPAEARRCASAGDGRTARSRPAFPSRAGRRRRNPGRPKARSASRQARRRGWRSSRPGGPRR